MKYCWIIIIIIIFSNRYIYINLFISLYIYILASLDTKSELFFKHLPETVLCVSGLFFDIRADVGCDTCYDNVVLVTWNLPGGNFMIRDMDMIKTELLISWKWRREKIVSVLIGINCNSFVFNILLDYFLICHSYMNNISFLNFFFFLKILNLIFRKYLNFWLNTVDKDIHYIMHLI